MREAAGWDVALVFGAQLVAALATAGSFFLARSLLDAIGDGRHVGEVVPQLIALGVILVVAGGSAAWQSVRSPLVAEQVGRTALDRLIDACLTEPYDSFLRPDFHNRLRRAQESALDRPWQLASGLLAVGQGGLSALATAVVVAAVAPAVLVVVIAGAVPLWMLTRRGSSASYAAQVELTDRVRERWDLLLLLIGREAAAELRAFGAGPVLQARHDRLAEEQLAVHRRIAAMRLRHQLIGQTILAVVAVGGVAVLVARADGGDVAGAAVAVGALAAMTGSLRTVNTGLGALHECALFLEDYERFLASAPKAVAEPRPDGALAAIELRGVGYTYPGNARPALRDIDLRLARGELVAVVGPNGSGKTTLALMLSGLLDPTDGAVLVDGHPLVELDAAHRRALFAPVLQVPLRYPADGAMNIGLGYPDRLDDIEAIRRSAADAEVQAVLDALPAGFATPLVPEYQGGVDLSAGQWQRLALARALLASTPMVVLDEPTANLDAATEDAFVARLRALAANRIIVVIAHRPAAVAAAHRVVHMDHGRVVEVVTR